VLVPAAVVVVDVGGRAEGGEAGEGGGGAVPLGQAGVAGVQAGAEPGVAHPPEEGREVPRAPQRAPGQLLIRRIM